MADDANSVMEPELPLGRGSRMKRAVVATEALNQLPAVLEAVLYGGTRRKDQVDQLIATLEPSYGALAKRLRRIVPDTLQPVPPRPDDLLTFETPRFGLDEVVLTSSVRSSLLGIVAEHEKAEDLARYRLYPRHRILLHGPPGNGKTMIAEGLAKELALPFFSVRYGGLIDSHMGETGANLEKLFRYVNAVPCLLFFDEFDSVAVQRGASNEVGEMRRVTNQLLIWVEKISPRCVFVAATNEHDSLDIALQRRFDSPIEVAAPDYELRLDCARRQLGPAVMPDRDLSALAPRVAALPLRNLNAVTRFCERIRRDVVLNDGNGIERQFQEAFRTQATGET
ncbi:MAG: ATP-binding protein [Sinobacteraceae bacterium]|nr:ATP-binding protein [Nevskiaceae bacterium]